MTIPSKTLTRTLAVSAAVLALSIGAAAWAQPAPAEAPGAAPGHEHIDREAMRARMEARRQERLQTLHDALGLRSDQDNAWQAFVADVRPAGRDHDGQGRMGRQDGGRPDGAGPMTTPERLDRMAKRMDERQAAFARHADAVKRFYAALSPTQQRTFDALSRLRMGGEGGMGRFGHGRG